jgi:hypothetical protein
MNQLIEKNLVQLKILAKIPVDGKLCTNSSNNGISLEKDSMFQGVWRTIRMDSRIESIRTIKEIIFDAIDITNNMIQSTFLNIYVIKEPENITHFEKEEFDRLFLLLKQYSQEMKNVIIGLRHLQDTYKEDADIVAKIEVALDHIRYQIVQIEQKLAEIS